MRIVDRYDINDSSTIFSVELAEDRFVDVKVCADGGPVYVMENEDGSTVYSDKAYSPKWDGDLTFPGFEYDEKAVLELVKEAILKGENVMDERFEELKRELFLCGQDYIEDFLGYEIESDEDKDVTERRMDMVYEQMPEEELEKFYAKHGIDIDEKVRVAIESTDDYSNSEFYSRLVDSDIQFEDGCYGRVVDYFRIVAINENGRIDKFDDRVFESAGEARTAVLENKGLELVSYEKIVHEAGKGLGAVLANATARSEAVRGGSPKGQELDMA